MQIAEAQREVRTVFMGGFVGQLVSGGLWLVSAALGTWLTPRYGILLLVFGGMFIFPLTQAALRVMGRRASLGADNPMGQLAMQVAFTIPLAMPVIGAATLHRTNWFYPACMIVVGAHYLPFCFLYGMWEFALLAAALVGAGLGLGLYLPGAFSPGGWLTGALLVLFAFILRSRVLRLAAGSGG